MRVLCGLNFKVFVNLRHFRSIGAHTITFEYDMCRASVVSVFLAYSIVGPLESRFPHSGAVRMRFGTHPPWAEFKSENWISLSFVSLCERKPKF